MKLTAKDPKASEVEVVFVDGKAVLADVLELDTDEGWVLTAQPELDEEQKTITFKDTTPVVEDEDDVPTFGWKKVKLTGVVEVRFQDGTIVGN